MFVKNKTNNKMRKEKQVNRKIRKSMIKKNNKHRCKKR